MRASRSIKLFIAVAGIAATTGCPWCWDWFGDCDHGDQRCRGSVIEQCDHGDWERRLDCDFYNDICVESGDDAFCVSPAVQQ